VLDRWLLSGLNTLARDVDQALENYDTQRAGKLLSEFVDDLSNWYVRRSRRRFWAGDPAALATLHETVDTLTRLMAPLTPFITERVWQDLIRPAVPDAPESVHMAPWPVADESLIDEELQRQTAVVRRLVELGRATRADSGVRTRQPLASLLITSQAYQNLTGTSAGLLGELAEELNVREVGALEDAGDLVDRTLKANFRSLGRRYGKRTPKVAAALTACTAEETVDRLAAGERVFVTVEGEEHEILAEDVIVTETPREGWAVATEQGLTVALDLTLTDELRRAGAAREFVRAVQEARKGAGLEVTDRIELVWDSGDEETVRAITEHTAAVADEVLAVSCARGAVPAGAEGWTAPAREAGLDLTYALRRAEV
jgi:isoleucyl-tRNA synthetase